MKNKIIFGLVLSILITSCSTSNEVASNKLIQKRKYNKGFHIEMGNKVFKKQKHDKETIETIAQNRSEEKVPVAKISTEQQEVISETVEITSVPETQNVHFSKETERSEVITVDNDKVVEQKSTPNQPNINQNLSQSENIVSSPKKTLKKQLKSIKKNRLSDKASNSNSADDMLILLVILCFIIPFVAVGIKTDWDITKVLISLLLSILFWIPGVIYALLVVLDVI